MKYGYVRVSTVSQNDERQLSGLELDRVFIDKVSGKDTNRPALQELLSVAVSGDVIHVHDISRLARDLGDLNSIIESLTSKGITIVFEKEHLRFSGNDDAMSRLMLNLLGAVYQFERSMLLERQKEGIALAKEKGKYKGRSIDVDLHERLKAVLKSGMSIREAAKVVQCSTATAHKVKRLMENEKA